MLSSSSRRLIAALVAALVGLLLVAPASQAAPPAPRATSANGVPNPLRVGTEGVYTPFSYPDAQGRLTGYDVDLVTAVAEELGVCL